MKEKIDIATEHYFPYHFIVLGIAFLLMALFLSLPNPPLAAILLVLGLLVTTTHYRININAGKNQYREYLWILGFKKGKVQPYQNAEYVYVNKVETSNEYGFVARLSTRSVIYKAFLKLSDDNPVFIGKSKNEGNLIKKVNKLSDILHLQIRTNY